MNEMLKIDEEFRNMIPPLTSEEYSNLESSLRREGCRDAIVAWNNIIVDGHNRYEICRKWNIPYSVIYRNFQSREEAVSWICLNQLSRRNLTREAYKYLIGKRYAAEKAVCTNQFGRNQYTPAGYRITGITSREAAARTSKRLAGEYHLTHSTVERYGDYSRYLDRIEEKKPGILPSLLSGKYRISHKNLSLLSRESGKAIEKVLDRIEKEEEKSQAVPLNITSAAIRSEVKHLVPEQKLLLDMKIKEMPEYNPDAEINGLTFTIRTWIDMIVRLKGVPVRYASRDAKTKMCDSLNELQRAISELREEAEEKTCGTN